MQFLRFLVQVGGDMRRKHMVNEPYCASPDLIAAGTSDSADRAHLVIPASPCEECGWRETCALQSLACRVFLHYVSKGTIIDGRRRPNRATYLRLFGPVTKGESRTGEVSATLDWIDELTDP